MIKTDYIFDDIDSMLGMWVPDSDTDISELAQASDSAVAKKISMVSVPVGVAEKVWPWIEHDNVKILTRLQFDLTENASPNDMMSNLAMNAMDAFKHGASGVQVFLSRSMISDFINALLPVRDSLFFERFFSIALNIDDVPDSEWENIFALLAKVRPNALLITAEGDSFNPKSDFTGRIFGMLEKWNGNMALHVMFGRNMMKVSQTLRLMQKMRPELVDKFRVFTLAN